MKSILLSLFVLSGIYSLSAQQVLELDGTQSMCITGKGPGQDGAINPYINSDSYAIVENMGKNTFEVRIEDKGEIVDIIALKSNEKKKILLLKGQVLYFDTTKETKVKVDFEEKKE